MSYNPADYSDVINKFTNYYQTSSQEAWRIINEYDIDPNQLMELIPQLDIKKGTDGLYRIYTNAGETYSYVNQTTVPMGSSNAVQEAINSNTQTGTASTATKVKWAGNSVIDEQGKVKTTPGVTKYSNGSVVGNIMGVVGSVVSGIGAAATGISLGKAIDSALYNANPTFWNSLGLDTLDPATWNSITSDLGDTGAEGALKSAFNFIFGIDNSTGKTQAYMDADAFNYIAYALAQKGLFDVTGAYDVPGEVVSTVEINRPVSIMQPGDLMYGGSGNNVSIRLVSATDAYVVCIRVGNMDTWFGISPAGVTGSVTYETGTGDMPATWRQNTRTVRSSGSVNVNGNTFTCNINQITAYQNTRVGFYTTAPANIGSGDATLVGILAGYYIINGTASSGIPGTDDQPGATTPTGISSTSSQQDVTNAISNQFPNLYNDRIEQSVVQPDGTTKTKIYYPVPIPNGRTDTTVNEDKEITIDSEVSVILPQGQTITLPDGTTITGDGTTTTKLPAGTYTLPSGTVVKNNYITDSENTTGGSQASTTAESTSTDTLLQTLLNILTNPYPQSLTDTPTPSPDETETTTDTGDGIGPSPVIPTGSASALWSVYNPTISQLNSLGAWLWSSNFIDQLLKMFSDPMQAIIGLHKTFIPPATGPVQNIVVGYLDSGVSCLTVPTQYSSVDCGTVNLSEYFGNVFDYSPYTRAYIYLPFVGFKELDISQVMRSTINVKYYGDAYTGAGLAEVKVTRDAGAGGVLYTYGCDVAAKYPLSSGSYMGIVNSIAGLAVGVGGALMGAGGLSALGGLHAFQNARTRVEQSGGFSGNSGAMGIKKPYIVVMRPQTAMANNYQHFSGAPSNSYITISDASGLIRVRECHVEHIYSATDREKEMISTALKEGVII